MNLNLTQQMHKNEITIPQPDTVTVICSVCVCAGGGFSFFAVFLTGRKTRKLCCGCTLVTGQMFPFIHLFY